MQRTTIKIALFLNYFVFAILLNSVGIVMLKAQNVYGISETGVSILEGCKDLPIAIVSFFLASFLPRIGYKKAMLAGLGIVAFACLGMYFGNSFLASKLLFVAVGSSFALIKISVYSTIGLVTDNEQEHNSLMSNIEGFFMFGIALAYFLFPAFNSESSPDAWLNVYLLLAAISILSFLFLLKADFNTDEEIVGSDLLEDISGMLKLVLKPLVLIFVASAFLFVMIEQGIMSWLPSFNNKVLNLPENIAIMMSSILAVSLGIGRFGAGFLAKKFSWFSILTFCIIAAMLVVWFVLPLTVNADIGVVTSLKDIPAIGYAFPLVGLFIAPIYPMLNSVVLSALPKKLHSHMSGLIIIFSALGGTLGSQLIGRLFDYVGGETAFTYTLIPMAGLFLAMLALKRLTADK